MSTADDETCAEVHRQLEAYGVLLLQDKSLPSVVGIFAGPLSSSWWKDPRAQAIFRCLDGIEDDEAVTARLFLRKVTFIHRRLYAALMAVGSAQEEWQLAGLSSDAQRLLNDVARRGQMPGAGKASRELQDRLLAASTQQHTADGRHETVVESWKAWGERLGVKPLRGAKEARAEFEAIAEQLEASPRALPWSVRRPKR
jgi:hypothetical protein